jgi:hypothetical protein
VLNRIVAYLVDGLDQEGREKFFGELYAPEAGVDAAESTLWSAIEQVAEVK